MKHYMYLYLYRYFSTMVQTGQNGSRTDKCIVSDGLSLIYNGSFSLSHINVKITAEVKL